LLALGVIGLAFAAAFYFQISDLASLPYADPNSAHRWLYRTPVTRLGDFLLGIVASMLFTPLSTQSLGARRWRALTYGAIVAFVALMLWDAHLYSAFSWDASFAALAFALILGLALAPATAIARFLARPSVVLLGEASYALYLIHYFLMDIFRIKRLEGAPPITAISVWFLFFAVCVAFAVALHLVIETPIRHWIRNQVNQRVSIVKT
jgi:peptidoglycan/LPS O-acetylase OafA/YrhL